MRIRNLLVGPALVFGLAPLAPAGIGPVPMDAVMADSTLFSGAKYEAPLIGGVFA